MRLGILTDIHEAVEHLAAALEVFRRERVDRVVFIGDVVCTGERLGPTVELLRTANPLGVWGNHDFGLCRQPAPSVRQRYSPAVLKFMATLRPRLELAGCLFSHVEPWLDPNDVAQLWYYEGPPDTAERAARSFDACPNRLIFVGHYHRWLAATRAGLLDWDGSRPLVLAPPERYLVAVGAACNGHCAVFDAESNELVPYRLAAE